jgi:dienelactone hydrolase/urea transporter
VRAVSEFLGAWCRGIGQIGFAGSIPGGLLLLAGILLFSPWAAGATALGAAVGTALGLLGARSRRDDWRYGLSGYNAGVVGLIVSGVAVLPIGYWIVPVAAAFAACFALEWLGRRLLARVALPILTAPSVIAVTLVSLVAAPSGVWFWFAPPASPLGEVGAALGVLCILAAMALTSVAATWLALVLAILTGVAAHAFLGLGPFASLGLWAYAVALAAFGMRAAFVTAPLLGAVAGIWAAVLAALIWLAWQRYSLSDGVPALVFPFIIGMWVALLLCRLVWRKPLFQPAYWRMVGWAVSARLRGQAIGALRGPLIHWDPRAGGSARWLWLASDKELDTYRLEHAGAVAWARREYWDAIERLRGLLQQPGAASPAYAHAGDIHVHIGVAPLARAASRPRRIFLHGDAGSIRCAACRETQSWPPSALWRRVDLRCQACGGFLMPAVSILDSDIDAEGIARASRALGECGFVLVDAHGPLDRPLFEQLLTDARRRGVRVIDLVNGDVAPHEAGAAASIPVRWLETVPLKLILSAPSLPAWLRWTRRRRKGAPASRAPRPTLARFGRAAGIGLILLLGGSAVAAYTLEQRTLPAPQALTFGSFDASWNDIRVGSYKARPITMTGWLYMPPDRGERIPAVVLVHGSDGVTAHQAHYARMLREAGYAAFVIDSFTARGVTHTIENQRAVSAYTMTLDAYQALALLAAHPRIDPERIAIVGWSKGGSVVLNAAHDFFRAGLAVADRRFAAHVAFYPWCGERSRSTEMSGAPILLLLGADDNWSGYRHCVETAERIRDHGTPIEVVTYPGAIHGFDYAGFFRRYLPRAQNLSGCSYIFDGDGVVDERDGRMHAWDKFEDFVSDCARRGAYVGTDAAARSASQKRLLEFLSTALRPR